MNRSKVNLDERLIRFDERSFELPEQLLMGHARGRLLFIAGAGVSYGSSLPDFRKLTREIYKKLDPALYAWMEDYETAKKKDQNSQPDYSSLDIKGQVEAKYYAGGAYDVVLGILERRMDTTGHSGSAVRKSLAQILLDASAKPNLVHKSLLKLADRGGASALVTTNFDRMFQDAARAINLRVPSYAMGSIPRPDRGDLFSGLFHIHGLLNANPLMASDLILTEQDFGEYYLRRRTAPDFLYDALRLYDLVFVGYSVNDPPMQYLMSAVAADAQRYPDLGKRYILVGCGEPDEVEREDWHARGFLPVFYDNKEKHRALGHTLEQWAKHSAINGQPRSINARIKRIASCSRDRCSDADRDLFDHLYRRSNSGERENICRLITKADLSWLTAINEIERERVS